MIFDNATLGSGVFLLFWGFFDFFFFDFFDFFRFCEEGLFKGFDALELGSYDSEEPNSVSGLFCLVDSPGKD